MRPTTHASANTMIAIAPAIRPVRRFFRARRRSTSRLVLSEADDFGTPTESHHRPRGQRDHARSAAIAMSVDEQQIRTLIENWAAAVHSGDMEVVLADHAV